MYRSSAGKNEKMFALAETRHRRKQFTFIAIPSVYSSSSCSVSEPRVGKCLWRKEKRRDGEKEIERKREKKRNSIYKIGYENVSEIIH